MGNASHFQQFAFVAIPPYEIGRFTYIGEMTHISQMTTIGKFCAIGNLCTIGAQPHNWRSLTTFPFQENLDSTVWKPTSIGNDVWVGSNVVVLGGVTVGSGAVLGAGAVVTKDVPPYAIMVGNPARILRYRFAPDLVAGLLETAWWDRPDAVLRTLPISDPAKCVELLLKAPKTQTAV